MAIQTYTPTGIVHHTEVDFLKRFVQKPVHIVQYDDTLPVLAVKLYLNGQAYVLPGSAIAKLKFGKPDSTYSIIDPLGCDSTRTVLYFAVTSQMTIFDGEFHPVIELMVNSKTGHSSPICIVIDRNPIQRDDVESSTEYKDLMVYRDQALNARDEAVTAANNITANIGRAETSATTATAAAETATNAMNSANAAATVAVDSSSVAQESATNARSSELNAAKSEQIALTSGTEAKEAAIKAKASEELAKTSETNAKSSEEIATRAETNSATSEANAKNSEIVTKEAEVNAVEIVEKIREDLANKVFNGAQGPKGDKGDPGESGVMIPAAGMIAVSVNEEGHLIVYYNEADKPPEMKIENGHLFIKINEEG